jgi:hypothetical protein
MCQNIVLNIIVASACMQGLLCAGDKKLKQPEPLITKTDLNQFESKALNFIQRLQENCGPILATEPIYHLPSFLQEKIAKPESEESKTEKK